MNSTVSAVIGATVTLVAIYLFVANADESSRVIRAISGGYAEMVNALQGGRYSKLPLSV
jgi:hypothetical protein